MLLKSSIMYVCISPCSMSSTIMQHMMHAQYDAQK